MLSHSSDLTCAYCVFPIRRIKIYSNSYRSISKSYLPRRERFSDLDKAVDASVNVVDSVLTNSRFHDKEECVLRIECSILLQQLNSDFMEQSNDGKMLYCKSFWEDVDMTSEDEENIPDMQLYELIELKLILLTQPLSRWFAKRSNFFKRCYRLAINTLSPPNFVVWNTCRFLFSNHTRMWSIFNETETFLMKFLLVQLILKS